MMRLLFHQRVLPRSCRRTVADQIAIHGKVNVNAGSFLGLPVGIRGSSTAIEKHFNLKKRCHRSPAGRVHLCDRLLGIPHADLGVLAICREPDSIGVGQELKHRIGLRYSEDGVGAGLPWVAVSARQCHRTAVGFRQNICLLARKTIVSLFENHDMYFAHVLPTLACD